ncbi:hypothetical protein [Labrys sp. ZIDIC5]|uniref:hypothetical protein n=1 Tax=Labrys sedimenti TaxID=3106036 RepID=UPI002ACB006A|nr:hypothetical protein [Labrys sp. ZIDIC5]MDZ5448916.1 hypothetical protein [Labrys sp. ZIDIC5]
MARIRTIKPEFWSSEQVMECSPNARLLFIGLWNFADDAGRMTNSAKRIKAQIFPSDDFSSETVRGMIDELASNGLLLIYTIENIEYIQITGWKHQKIDKPQPSKIPAPSTNAPSNIKPHSPNALRTVADGREWNGRDLKGEEPNPEQQPPEGRASQAALLEDLEIRCREAAGIENDPSPGLLVIGPIADLIEAGWSLDRHVLPALRSAKAGGRKGKTWTYYAKIITDGAAEPPRAVAPPTEQPKPELTERHLVQQARQYIERGNDWPFNSPPPGAPGTKITPEILERARAEVSAERQRRARPGEAA